MIKINKLEIENIKRVKAVKIQPAQNGLTVIGGRNNQGKTSVLDAIAWALGGNKYKPSQATREGSVIPPHLSLVMSNGLVIERKGKNSDLKITDPKGSKSGQQLLNEFVEELAINLPKFMESTSKEKADILLKIIGVGDKLSLIEIEEKEVYNKRHTIGQIADQKMKFAKEMTYYPDVPNEIISAIDLIRQQQDILATNGENQRKRNNLKQLQQKQEHIRQELERWENELKKNTLDLEIALDSTQNLQDENTTQLERNIEDIEIINSKIRTNLDKEKAEDEAKQYLEQYERLSTHLQDIRRKKIDLLQNANLPLEGLSVTDRELTYNGKNWDNMSGSDQLKVSTAIIRKLNPNCGFVLLDKLEQMDNNTLTEFGEWLERENLQAIATRVSSGDECSIIIEDGYVVGNTSTSTWKAGDF